MTNSTSTQKERVNEKYGWLVFLGLGLLWVVVGLTQAFNPVNLPDAKNITGMSYSELEALYPEATELVRFVYGALGVLKTSWSLLVIVITLIPYRRGEKWAWYTMWLVPATLVGQGLFNSWLLGDFNEMLIWIPVTIVSLLGLFLPHRKFFPR